ncbi:MAG TPA: hypothetical protein VFC23_16005, partial [Thermoanaerobaculia bacterium]|nr:hypothetical protein [Thermoanaerobaculia bacterium]
MTHGPSNDTERARSFSGGSSEVAAIIEKSILERWIDDVMASDPRLREARPGDRDRFVEEFQELDRAMIEVAAA